MRSLWMKLAACLTAAPIWAQEVSVADPSSIGSRPLPNLDLETRAAFFVGNALFDQIWEPAPGDPLFDGLGPLYNASSCRACHLKAGRGPRPEEGDAPKTALLFVLSDEQGNPDPNLGAQWQDLAVERLAAEGMVSLNYTTLAFKYPDGSETALQRPNYAVSGLSPGVALNPRMTPPIVGSGLIEAIPEEAIVAGADPNDLDGNGISGRVPRLADGALGRFGWKATTGSVLEQSALAMAQDMGLSTWVFPDPHGDCTALQSVCRSMATGEVNGLPEVREDHLDLITTYTSHLAPPSRMTTDDQAVTAGEALFSDLGCATCHTPSFRTDLYVPPALADQVIWPYSDFLLHDMGPDLADATPTGLVPGYEWRTPPLWGLGQIAAGLETPGFLHDGRARTIEEAILWHGGEALTTRDRFAALPSLKRAELLAFLGSL